MRVAHFDCFSGASGDMILGALIDAGVDVDAIRAGLDSLGLPIKLAIDRVKRGGIAATHARVEAPHEHAHRHLHHIETIIDKGRLTDRQKGLAKGFFRRLAEAEAQVHGIPIEKVHFHEVGALDSIADFVGAAIGLDLLAAERITSRSVPPGSGTVKCDHGVMPVPAPATALLLRGVPLAASTIDTELTTPTGAAILTSVVTEWTDSPTLTVERIGHGAGTKDFLTQPNVLRLLVGTAAGVNPAEADTVWVMETNLDDVPGEVIGYTVERLFAAGALDVWTTAVQMKKSRPGVVVSVLADAGKLVGLETILFRETGTLGIRRCRYERTKQPREATVVETPWGPVRIKAGKPEYEDCARIARDRGLPLRDVVDAVTPPRG
ncbi:MAG TPA: nickel pincer cofactor biosynthesis protein LarC [Gemmataceae bacterium]